MKNVKMAVDGAIGRITLARPGKKNALDRATADDLAEALFALSEAPVRVIAIDGEGPDFCAGADLAALEQMLDAPRQEHIDDAESRELEHEVVDAANTIAVFVTGPAGIRIEYVEHKPGFALK